MELRYAVSIATLSIITGAETAILRTKTTNVPSVTKNIVSLLKDMEETMKSANGLGLAAPQVGQSLRLCLACINDKITPLINPEILWKSNEEEIAEEGCLSLPGIFVPVPRSRCITLNFIDLKGHSQERKLASIDARIVQHELDHLEGILIVDYQ